MYNCNQFFELILNNTNEYSKIFIRELGGWAGGIVYTMGKAWQGGLVHT